MHLEQRVETVQVSPACHKHAQNSYLSFCFSYFFVHRVGVKTLGVSSRILSKGFRLWALWLALCSKGSDFGRFGLHLEQRVETLAVRPVF